MTDAEHLAALKAELQRWGARRSADPYDRTAREEVARVLFAIERDRFPPGSPRGRLLLLIMSEAFPIASVRAAYLSNLRELMAARPSRAEAGQVVLGLGSGRCGSTTLTALLATVEASCSTHENPPHIDWTPIEEQVDFHFERMGILSRSYSLVFDAAHWWLGALDAFFARFPAGRVLGLFRDPDACAESFLSINGRRAGSVNHWVPPGSGIWPPNAWDPLYPTYPLPAGAAADPEGTKRALIRRYVAEYNDALTDQATRHPRRVLLVRTEDLSRPETQEAIFAFLGVVGRPFDRVLNAATVADGRQAYWF
jgi:hypothetical protein